MSKYLFVLIIMFTTAGLLMASGTKHKFKSSSETTIVKIKTLTEPVEKPLSSLSWYQMITRVPADDYLFFKNNFTLAKASNFVELAALTGALMSVDKSGWKYNKHIYRSSSLFRNASDATVFMGNGESHFILSGLFAAYGLIRDDPSSLKTASNIVEAELSAGLLVQLLKRITGRESPGGSDKSLGSWKFFPSIKEYQKHQSKYYSFPSGHLAAATAVLTVIANDYPNCTWIRPAGYGLLGLLSFSLVSKGMHWYSDLPLGFFIGYSIGNIVAPESKAGSDNKSQENSRIIIAPSFGNSNIGLRLAYTF